MKYLFAFQNSQYDVNVGDLYQTLPLSMVLVSEGDQNIPEDNLDAQVDGSQ